MSANLEPPRGEGPIPLALFAQPVRSMEEVQEIIKDLRRKSFPELQNVKIDIETYKDKPYYSFEARPNALFGSLEGGGLLLRVNQALFDVGYPRYVLEAVLAHELAHGVWYLQRGDFGSVAGALSYLGNRAGFEKATDLEAVRRGYGAGLAAHRLLLLERFPEFVKERTGLYLTAEEIRRVMHDRADPLWKVWASEFSAVAS